MSKKVVLRLDLHDGKDKQKALKCVSGISGIESLAMNMKDKKLTVTGEIDPVQVVSKLRKNWHVEILTVGPAKDDKMKDDGKKESRHHQAELFKGYNGYNPYPNTCYYAQNFEDHPNGCIIC